MLSSFGSRVRRAKRRKLALYLLTVAGVIFRSELAILVATVSASLMVIQRVPPRTVILPAGIFAAVVGLLVTVSVDSFFWQRFPLWPEWVAFRFNTIEGKSADWGTSPWHFYFTNSIPRLMMNPMPLLVCIPIALAVKATRKFSIDTLIPLLGYVVVYSILPHKEWRFIIYTIPGLTAVASAGASWIWSRKYRSSLHGVLCMALVGSTAASFGSNIGLLYISSLNYPGAMALNRLHELARSSSNNVNVHLDNLSCQTGITRFLELPAASGSQAHEARPLWSYDKTEEPVKLQDQDFWRQFDFVLAEHGSHVPGDWRILESIDGYAGIGISKRAMALQVPTSYKPDRVTLLGVLRMVETMIRAYVTRGRWLEVRMEPKIDILKRRRTRA